GYLKVGTDENGNRRVCSRRPDRVPAKKLQGEDDITVSTMLPIKNGVDPSVAIPYKTAVPLPPSREHVQNGQYAVVQRRGDAIVAGLDPQAERDLSDATNFISNYEPLPVAEARWMKEEANEMGKYTAPMRLAIEKAAARESGYFVCTS